MERYFGMHATYIEKIYSNLVTASPLNGSKVSKNTPALESNGKMQLIDSLARGDLLKEADPVYKGKVKWIHWWWVRK